MEKCVREANLCFCVCLLSLLLLLPLLFFFFVAVRFPAHVGFEVHEQCGEHREHGFEAAVGFGVVWGPGPAGPGGDGGLALQLVRQAPRRGRELRKRAHRPSGHGRHVHPRARAPQH